MIKAIFLDFYGTVVHEDDMVIDNITELIFQKGKAKNKEKIGAFWWDEFSRLCSESNGGNFRLQRELELIALQKTVHFFCADAAIDANS